MRFVYFSLPLIGRYYLLNISEVVEDWGQGRVSSLNLSSHWFILHLTRFVNFSSLLIGRYYLLNISTTTVLEDWGQGRVSSLYLSSHWFIWRDLFTFPRRWLVDTTYFIYLQYWKTEGRASAGFPSSVLVLRGATGSCPILIHHFVYRDIVRFMIGREVI